MLLVKVEDVKEAEEPPDMLRLPDMFPLIVQLGMFSDSIRVSCAMEAAARCAITSWSWTLSQNKVML
jgi:hypothetical protein